MFHALLFPKSLQSVRDFGYKLGNLGMTIRVQKWERRFGDENGIYDLWRDSRVGTRIKSKMGWNENRKKNGNFGGDENGERKCVREPK